MPLKPEDIKLLKDKALEVKNEFINEVDELVSEIENENVPIAYRGEEGTEKQAETVEDYEKKLEALKNDLKNLKKIRKNQKKISKLEEEKVDVIRDIEKKKELEKRLGKRKKH